jgi:hypothetical protein
MQLFPCCAYERGVLMEAKPGRWAEAAVIAALLGVLPVGFAWAAPPPA